MRIVVHGQEAFGKAVLERLLERGENVVAVCCAPDKAGRPEDPLKAFAVEKGLPLYQPKSWKTPEALELMKSFNADVCMMAYVLLFVPQPVLEAPRLGTFQYHPSLLPAFPGLHTHRSALAAGVRVHGATVHFVTATLDSGPIVIQAAVPVQPDDDEATLAARVLAQEHRIYPQAVRWFVDGRLSFDAGGRVRIAGAADAGAGWCVPPLEPAAP